MIAHSAITAVFMACALGLCWFLGGGPDIALAITTFITGWWWSREQYFEELELRKIEDDEVWGVVESLLVVWWPTQKNMDLLAPVAVAWLLLGAYINLVLS